MFPTCWWIKAVKKKVVCEITFTKALPKNTSGKKYLHIRKKVWKRHCLTLVNNVSVGCRSTYLNSNDFALYLKTTALSSGRPMVHEQLWITTYLMKCCSTRYDREMCILFQLWLHCIKSDVDLYREGFGACMGLRCLHYIISKCGSC